MNITQTAYSPYMLATNKERGVKDTLIGQAFEIDTLDEEANDLLNEVLNGKSDQEKWMIKLSIDLTLSTEIKNETLVNISDIDNSKSKVIGGLEEFVQTQRELGNPDMLGTIETVERLLEEYQKNETVADIKDKEDSVVDNFFNELYSKESIDSLGNITQNKIDTQIEDFSKTLDQEFNYSDEEKVKIIEEYKGQLIEELESKLKDKNGGDISLEKQAIIKVLLENNETTKESSLELLLTQKTDSIQNKDSTKNGANYYMTSLDAKGNEIVNNIISKRTDTEKFAIKAIMDRGLNFKNTKAYAMAVDAFNEHESKSNVDMSAMLEVALECNNEFKDKESFLNNLDEFIEKQSKTKSTDPYGILEVAKQLKSEYI